MVDANWKHFLCCLCHFHWANYQVKMCVRESIAKPHHPNFAFFRFQTYGGICLQTEITCSCCLCRSARSRCVYYQVKEWVRESIAKVSVLNLLLSPLMCHWTVLMCLLHKCPSISKSNQAYNMEKYGVNLLVSPLMCHWTGVHKSRNVLPSWTDPGSSAHKRVCYYFLYRRDKCRK